jgi:excisionase family DNA binding protein
MPGLSHSDHRRGRDISARAENNKAIPTQVRTAARNAEQAAVELATQLGHLTDKLEVLASAQTRSHQAPPPVMLTPEQAANALAISRSAVYALLRGGQLKSVKIGACRRVPAEALNRYVAHLGAADQD